MLHRSGQMGVPVIAVDGSVVAGFDQPRLAQLLAEARDQRRRLGASVASLSGGGLLVGQVHPGSQAAEAGLQPGDVILGVNGTPLALPEDLQVALREPNGAARRLRIRRSRKFVYIRLAG